MLTVVDRVHAKMSGHPGGAAPHRDVLQQPTELFVARGTPAYLRSDNGPELTANAVREWLARVGVTLLFMEPGSPWENGYIESFNGKLRDELLDRELFYTLAEAQILTERWRHEYNHLRCHSALGYRPPAPEAIAPLPLRLSSVALPDPLRMAVCGFIFSRLSAR